MLKHHLFMLHVAVFLFGFTAILGKLLTLDEYNLVAWRMAIASTAFLVFPGIFKQLKATSGKHRIYFLSIGFLVALHWITFYGSIKAAQSASITLACFGLTASFTSLLEPLLSLKRPKMSEMLLGLLAFGGIYMIYLSAPGLNIEQTKVEKALGLGIFSSFLAALFSSMNAKLVKNASAMVMTFLELVGGCFIVVAYFWIAPDVSFVMITKTSDWLWMLLLCLVCTNLAFLLNMMAMKKVSAFTANIAINLEPVYGIILAAVIFHENQKLNIWFYLGTLIILATVFIHPMLLKQKSRRDSKKTEFVTRDF
jgi:drug/metabolite transporter (DMT)-like permease